MPCVAMDIYSDTHLKREVSDKNFNVSDTESRMATKEDDEVLIFRHSAPIRRLL
jgi:hypothetical protein